MDHGFPDPRDGDYVYHPKPIRPQPPIAPHTFNHYFYRRTGSGFLYQLLLGKRKRANQGNGDNVISIVPKRIGPLTEVGTLESFWGLNVIEKTSFVRVFTYSFALLSPFIFFFFAWIFAWDHPGDLQNGSVPLILCLAVLGMFWGSLCLPTNPYEAKLKKA